MGKFYLIEIEILNNLLSICYKGLSQAWEMKW